MKTTQQITEKMWFASFPGDPQGQCLAYLNGDTLDGRDGNVMWVDLDLVQENYPERLDILTEAELEDDGMEDEAFDYYFRAMEENS